MLKLFRSKPVQTIGRTLYARVVEQARLKPLYTRLGAPDTVEGRFEVYTLHVVILLDRLKRQGGQAADTAQSLFDAYVEALDNALREMGVGDLSVGKKMRKLGEAFYGRVKSYETAFAALPAREELEAVIGRTVYAFASTNMARDMADYVVRQRDAITAQPLDTLLEGKADWIEP